MPFYEYICHKCKLEISDFKLFSEKDDDVFCPDCPDVLMERLVTALSSEPKVVTDAKSRVDNFISKAKKDLQSEKDDLSRRAK